MIETFCFSYTKDRIEVLAYQTPFYLIALEYFSNFICEHTKSRGCYWMHGPLLELIDKRSKTRVLTTIAEDEAKGHMEWAGWK